MRLFFCSVIFLTGFVLGFFWANSEFIQKEKCLDSGGKWNKEQKYCEHGKEK